MPAQAPPIGELLAARLQALGQQIRTQRQQHKLSATVVAEAAGLSRVTLHRIERGEPSVTLGAYLSVVDAIGLRLQLTDPTASTHRAEPAPLPARIRLSDYPQLQQLAWQRPGVSELSPAEAFSLYERNWRHVDAARLTAAERELVHTLGMQLGGGKLLV